VRIFAGSAAGVQTLTALKVERVGNKLAAVALFLSSQFEETMILAKPAPGSLGLTALDTQQQCVSGMLVLVLSLEACCVHARHVYQSESGLLNAVN